MDVELFNSLIPIEIKWIVYYFYEWTYIASLKKRMLDELISKPQDRKKYFSLYFQIVPCKYLGSVNITNQYLYVEVTLEAVICSKCKCLIFLNFLDEFGHICNNGTNSYLSNWALKENLFYFAKIGVIEEFLKGRSLKSQVQTQDSVL